METHKIVSLRDYYNHEEGKYKEKFVEIHYYKYFTDEQIATIKKMHLESTAKPDDEDIDYLIVKAQVNVISFEGMLLSYSINGRFDFGAERFISRT